MAYATLSELRAYLKLGTSETGDDTLLTDLLTRAQAYIDSPQCCNRTFEASADTTRYFDATRAVDGLTLRLDYDLATTPTTVTNGDGTTIASTYYVLEPRNIAPYFQIRLKATSGIVWSYGDDPDNPIAVTGKFAYSVTAPTAIKQATLVLAAWFYRQRGANADVDRSVMADGMVIMPTSLPKVFWDLVGGYKRR